MLEGRSLEYAITVFRTYLRFIDDSSFNLVGASMTALTMLKFNIEFSRDLDSSKMITGRRSFASYLGNPSVLFSVGGNGGPL